MKLFRVGDLVTIWTGGWDKWRREKYEGRAGIIVSIGNDTMTSHIKYVINFGGDEIELDGRRLRLLSPSTDNKETE